MDNVTHPQVIALLNEHLQDMHSNSPPDAVHALNVGRLQSADVRFFSLWCDGKLAACGALKRLDGDRGELKSMRSANGFRGKGYGRKLLRFLIRDARAGGMTELYLETGNAPLFDAARALYSSEGFEYCGPFARYRENDFSCFMKLDLTHQKVSLN
nr:GNAT family N-acetyltransferase [Shewanella corallii]